MRGEVGKIMRILIYSQILTYFLESFISFTATESSISYLEGVQLGGDTKELCKNLSRPSWTNFHLCFFVKTAGVDYFSRPERQFTILVLKDNSNYIEFGFKHPRTFFIKHNGKTDEYLKAIDGGKWIRICLSRKEDELQVNLNINYGMPKKYPLPELQDIDDYKKMNAENEIYLNISAELPNKNLDEDLHNFSRICAGNDRSSSYNWTNFEIAGISVDEFSLSAIKSDNCFEAVKKLSFLENLWESHNLYSIEDLCFDTHVISYINKTGYYFEHHQMCKKLNGRFISKEEIKYFHKHFLTFWEIINEKDSSITVGLWLPGGNIKAKTLKDLCEYLVFPINEKENITKEVRDGIPCIVDAPSSLCISPAYTDFTLYGLVTKYDINYFLTGENFSFSLVGDELTYIEKKEDKWVLRSQLHGETCEMTDALPVGRNKWKIKKDEVSRTFTFTRCNRNEFACTNGDCWHWTVRCNGTAECSDKSDEELCQPIKKEKGYVMEHTPPPRKHESKFKIFYSTLIFNIADITSEKGIAVVDVFISLSWYDPRIDFWNPVKDQNTPCDKIWSPVLAMADNARSGFKIKFEKYRSFCQVFASDQEKDINRKHSFKDPYMGTYVKGRDMRITYLFSGLVTVPCRFNLRRFPFGTQTCNISFWADNAYLTKEYEFIYDNNMSYRGYKKYEGRKDLGEYLFISADHVIERSYFVTIIIRLKNLYGFHMLNSFTPSFLICVITFGTLFFPVTDFSERVSISLTSLLVLAALFTQASETSVITPYFKLLDIWYVVLIFYCFMIVIYNIVLHKVMITEEKRAKKAALRSKVEYHTGNSEGNISVLPEWEKRVITLNFIAIIFFAVSYLIFLLFFCLASAEMI